MNSVINHSKVYNFTIIISMLLTFERGPINLRWIIILDGWLLFAVWFYTGK